jgi:hypothetical protein
VSDAAVDGLIAEMEKYLGETGAPDADFVADWHERFGQAVEAARAAGHGPGWEEILRRGHALGDAIQSRIGGLSYEQEQLRRELNVQAAGRRAMKGYSSGLAPG